MKAARPAKHLLSAGLLAGLSISPLLHGSVTGLLIWVGVMAGLLFPLLFFDARFFGFSWASITLLAFVYPVFAALSSLFLGDLSVFSEQRLLIQSLRLPLALACMLYFYVVLSWLFYLGKKDLANFDGPSLASLELSPAWGSAFSAGAMILTYIVMPGIPKMLAGIRYGDVAETSRGTSGSNFLGSGTVLVPLLLCALAFASGKSSLRTAAIVFVPAWFLLNYARGVTFGLLLFFVLCSVARRRRNQPGKETNFLRPRTAWILVVFVMVVAGSAVEIVRSGKSLSAASLGDVTMRSLLEDDTVLNVVYSGMVCIDVSSAGTLELSQQWSPRDLLPYLLGGTGENAVHAMQLQGLSQGGVYAPFEAFLAGGLPPFLLSPFLLYFFLASISGIYRRIFGPIADGLIYVVLVIQVLIMPWYGIRNLSTPLLLVVPALAVLIRLGPRPATLEHSLRSGAVAGVR